MHVDEFLKTGGIPEWLNGLEYVPQRLKNLNEINKLLAHRPWLITKEHIQVLRISLKYRGLCLGLNFKHLHIKNLKNKTIILICVEKINVESGFNICTNK